MQGLYHQRYYDETLWMGPLRDPKITNLLRDPFEEITLNPKP